MDRREQDDKQLCMLVGGATSGALWTVRPAFYLVIGVLVYVALLGLAAHWFSAGCFTNVPLPRNIVFV
ncbi:hypothetical protein ACLBSN_33020, partial [Klebsiella pneumoniae]